MNTVLLAFLRYLARGKKKKKEKKSSSTKKDILHISRNVDHYLWSILCHQVQRRHLFQNTSDENALGRAYVLLKLQNIS